MCVCMCEEGTILLEIPPKVHKEMGLASVIHGYSDSKNKIERDISMEWV